MNSRTALLVVCVLLFASFALAQSQSTSQDDSNSNLNYPALRPDISGGINASNGRDLFFLPFATMKAINLTKDVPDAKVEDLFSFSEDGQTWFWLQDNMLFRKMEPFQKKVALLTGYKNQPMPEVDQQWEKEHLWILGKNSEFMLPAMVDEKGNCTDITLSPDGSRFSYDVDALQTAKIPIAKNSKLDVYWKKSYLKVMDKPDQITNLPMYVDGKEIYHGIRFKDLDSNRIQITSEPFPFIPNNIGHCACAAIAPYRTIYEKTPQMVNNGFTPPWVHELTNEKIAAKFPLRGSRETYMRKFLEKRNAYHGVWSKDSKMFAVINQTLKGWGPIEIYGETKNRILIIYEIPVSIKSCQGLAWKPDGSLSCFYEGKVYSFSGKEISANIENSRRQIDSLSQKAKMTMESPVIFIFNINPTVIAENISGSRFCWISDEAFIFRDKEKGLSVWKEGQVEKILYKVPERFVYCKAEPKNFVITNPQKAGESIAKVKNKNSLEEKTSEPLLCKSGDKLTIGNMFFYCFIEEVKTKPQKDLIAVLPNNRKIKYSLAEGDIDQINPFDYKNKTVTEQKAKFLLKEVLLVYSGNSCIALQASQIIKSKDKTPSPIVYRIKYWKNINQNKKPQQVAVQ